MWTFFAFQLSTLGATWRQAILHDGARLMDFKLLAIALVVITAMVALAPLAFFVPRLAQTEAQTDSRIWSFGANTQHRFSRQMDCAPLRT